MVGVEHVMAARTATAVGATTLFGAAWTGVRLLADQSVGTWAEGGIAFLFFTSLLAAVRIIWMQWQEDRKLAKEELAKLREEIRQASNLQLDEARDEIKRLKEGLRNE